MENVLDWVKRFEHLLYPLISLFLTLIIVPFLSRLYRLHKEQNRMIRKKILEHTGVVIFGVFDGKLQSDYLGGFLTALFGETLFDLIVGWNDRPSPSLIVPKSEHQSEHLKEILAAHASPFILQSSRIDCYFDGVETHGTPSYQFAKLVVALARPDANMLSAHDYPRVIVIEEETLRRIKDSKILPQWDTRDGLTWLETVRELAKTYFGGREAGIAILEVPLGAKR